ncbi:protein boule-like isoform X5 [Etheostoma cragini]|uniref:protein boule-like isoform X5 n=1 Tax=Etheostoma cragini TaxID=417921 RepID=UPI00155F3D1F|nr:protein boule-like isoform X5 [Etheostoma cragini]
MNVAMEAENQNGFTSSCPSENSSSSSTLDVLPAENHDESLTHHTPRHGTVIPNRIFVGGIDYRVNENDLRHVFSQHGAVKEVKIVIDRSGMSKGYGFVTFETQDDAMKVLHNANGICFNDKKLSIGQAVRKQQGPGQTKSVFVTMPDSAIPVPMSCGALHLTTSAGYPYTYHNGVAYFHCPNMSSPAHHWPQPAPPVTLPQSLPPVYQPPAYHHHQCAPNQCHWNVVQSPMPSSPVMFPQQSEYVYQPADGAPFQPPLPAMEDTTPENPMFPHSRVHLKPKYRRYIHHKEYHYLPEATAPPDASHVG